MPNHYWIWKLLSSGTEAQTGHFHWGQLPWAYHWSILYPRKQLNHLQHSQRSSRTTHQQVTVSDSSLSPTLQISVSSAFVSSVMFCPLVFFCDVCSSSNWRYLNHSSPQHYFNIISLSQLQSGLLLMMMMVIVEVHTDEDTGQQKQHHKHVYSGMDPYEFCICLTMNSLQTCPEWRKGRTIDDHEERRVLRKLAYGLKAL